MPPTPRSSAASAPARAPRRRLPAGQRAVESAVTLSESDGVRYLHFGSVWVQGAMRIRAPFALELAYQQQMMAPLLLLPEPARILQLGLGAAALTKFCWRYLAPAQVTVVELSPHVVACAQRWFRLPEPDERLRVVVDNARSFIALPRNRRQFDWLQVDLYDASARGPVFDDPEFYLLCRQSLRATGVAAFNFFGRHWQPSLEALAQAFGGRILVLPPTDAGNRVVLALTGKIVIDAQQIEERARACARHLRLPARDWVDSICAELDRPAPAVRT